VAEKLWALDLPSVRPLATFGNFSGASFFTGFFAGFFAGFLVGLAVAVAEGLADEVCELLGVG
jgi:tetrahydromethanopterin S-methyltransferase subunit B